MTRRTIPPARAVEMQAAEENKRAFRRTYDELLNRGKLALADGVIAPDFFNHEAPPGHNQGGCAMIWACCGSLA